jgi:tRNA uridine 5-carboxymethylaminomethyl modification enzyme
MGAVTSKTESIQKVVRFLKQESIGPQEINTLLQEKNTTTINQKVKLINVLARPQISIFELKKALPRFSNFVNAEVPEWKEEILQESEILIKYGGYIEKEKEIADRLTRLEGLSLSEEFDYFNLPSLSYEAREKLSRIKPRTIGQASRISGVSPADISVLTVYLGR